MKKWMTAALCVLLSALLCLPVLGGETADPAPYYTPTTAEDACVIPLNIRQGYLDEATGTLQDERWTTLYNPCTASMMIDMANASSKIGKNSDWEKTMEDYGYEQLYYTEDNQLYSDSTYHLGYWVSDIGEVQVKYSAINAIIGIQPVEYNGMTRYAIAVTFRGTHDWADVGADILQGVVTDLQGFHLGFSENAYDFYLDISKDVTFTVEGETYTLWEIYDEMKEQDSRFCMLVMGHSLGGALTDVLVGRYLYEHGVHPSNIAGYTIGAAPSAAFTYKYPYNNIYNIISVDDLVPSATIFANQHLGQVISYSPDDDFRREHYDVEGEFYPDLGNDWWQTVGFLTTLAKPHLIKSAYAPIVELINAEIAASTSENPSRYTSYSTSGCNNWGLESSVISPYTFGDFPKDVRSGGTLLFEGGVLQVEGNLTTAQSLHMYDEDDYLLVGGDLIMENGVHSSYPDHLTAGTVELKGDLSTGTYSFWNVPYHATGSHRTVLSGTEPQTIHFYGEQVSVPNLYLRNPKTTIIGMTYARLAEDAEIITDDLYIHQLDLNGCTLTQTGNLGVHTLTMDGGGLQVSGDAEIHTVTALDGTMTVGGSFETTSTLPFDGGSLSVGGDCYLPASMIMQNKKDYLRTAGTLTLYAREGDAIPDDHLSAGTVELKGDLEFDNMGVCEYNAYRESGTHRTILSGEGEQTIWFNRAGDANRFENLCIRNPLTSLYMVKNVRLGEDASVTVSGSNAERRWQIDGILDPGGHTLTVDTAAWENQTHAPVSVKAIRNPGGGKVDITGDLKLFDGTLQGDLRVTGDLTLDNNANACLDLAGGRLSVGGNCTLPRSLVMDSDDDYLFVGGDLTVRTDGTLTRKHLTAGTVELQGDLVVQESQNQVAYCATGTHRTIFSGADVQQVQMGGMNDHKVLQACLRNPDVVMAQVHTLRLMEGAAVSDISGWHLYGKLDLNGHKLTAQGALDPQKVPITDSQAPEGAPVGILQMTVDTDPEKVPTAVTITVPEAMVEEEDIHILFTGYDDFHRLVVCQAMRFTSESQMTQTLRRENWPDCKTTRIYWLEGDFAPFCTATSLGW